MYLSGHGEPEEFLFFISNINMNLTATGMLETDTKIQYICTLVHGEALRQFDLLSTDVETTETLNVDYYIKGLALHFPPVNLLLKKRAMRCGMKKARSLKVRRYAARLIDLNKYLPSILGATLSDKICVTKLNAIILNVMPNSWSEKACVQGFDCEYVFVKKFVNMLERMETAESIYEGVVEPSYKKPTRAYANHAGHSRNKRG